jgi:hypothetical protein
MPDRGRAADARPGAHADIYPIEVFTGGGNRVFARKELDPDCPERKLRRFSRAQILGEGLLVSTLGRDEEMTRSISGKLQLKLAPL